MYDLIIIQCVKSKIWDFDKNAPRFVPAKDAYVSNYFKKMWDFAQRCGKRWCVLSGKYGFALSETKIENYDATFVNLKTNPITVQEIKNLLEKDENLKKGLGLNSINSCAILGGKKYVKVAREVLADYQIEVVDLLEGLKIGERLKWLSEGSGKKEALTKEERKEKIVKTLEVYAKELYINSFLTVDRLKTAGLAKDKEDNQFIVNNPNAFLFGVIFDQQIKAERAWSAPRQLYRRLGNTLDLKKIIKIGPKKLAEILRQSPALHRFCNKLGFWLVEAAKILVIKYNGEAKNIWIGPKTKALEIIKRLSEFPGISQKKANMAASILVRDFKILIAGWDEIDIPYDIHIRRVFLRTGLADSDSKSAVVAVGRKYSPSYPGKLDLPAWYVGRNWCHPRGPECLICKLSSSCPKFVEKGRDIA